MTNLEFFKQQASEQKDKIIKVSDAIFDSAETLYTEFKSSDTLIEYLESEGFSVEKGVGGIPTAFKATFGKGKPVVGLLAEYDALSGLSQEANVFEQKPIVEGGNGHGCGHNLLGSGIALASVLIKRYLESNSHEGTVICFGCPAEEGGSGKTFMAQKGLFKGLDCALSWHPADGTGVVSISTAANVQMDYSFKGVAAHAGGSPHLGRSALDAVELMNVGANYLREHIIPDAKLHYAITDTGGFSPNVVQAKASVTYLIRGPHIEDAIAIRDRVDNIAKGAAMMTGTTVEIKFRKACSHYLPNGVIGSVLDNAIRELGLPEMTEEDHKNAVAIRNTITTLKESAAMMSGLYKKFSPVDLYPVIDAALQSDLCTFIMPCKKVNMTVTGSTDVGDVSLNCPTAWFQMVTSAQGTPGHSWQMVAQGKSDLSHKGMIRAGEVLAYAASKLYEDETILKKAWEEFKVDRQGNDYICPIPEEILPPIVKK